VLFLQTTRCQEAILFPNTYISAPAPAPATPSPSTSIDNIVKLRPGFTLPMPSESYAHDHVIVGYGHPTKDDDGDDAEEVWGQGRRPMKGLWGFAIEHLMENETVSDAIVRLAEERGERGQSVRPLLRAAFQKRLGITSPRVTFHPARPQPVPAPPDNPCRRELCRARLHGPRRRHNHHPK
jgi:hypothetical protein